MEQNRQLVFQQENSGMERGLDRRHYLNFTFPKNIHANPEMIYVAAGEMEITIDGRTEAISAGCFCIVLPWQIHSFATKDYSRSVVIVFSAQYVDIFAQTMLEFYGETQVFRAESDIHNLFLHYLYEGALPDECMISSVLLALCHCFASQCRLIPRFDRNTMPSLYNVMHYISANCHERLTLRDVADALGYSYFHLSHQFKGCVGMGFSQFCNMLRIERAQNRLRGSSATMTDIAFECGFSSVRNFNRIFSELVGMTPSEYRAKYSRSISGKRIAGERLVQLDVELHTAQPKEEKK